MANHTPKRPRALKRSAKPLSKSEAKRARRPKRSAAPESSAVDVQPTEVNNSEQIAATAPADDTPTAREGGFLFTSKQLQYLLAWREAALEGRSTSDSAISDATGISRTSIWSWNHDPAFVAWCREEVKTESDGEFELAVARL